MFDFLAKTTSLVSSSPEETRAFGRKISSQLRAGTVLCLEGDLGAGKTVFSKGLIASLTNTPEEEIQSPTFVYLNIYETPLFSICHFDLYRMNSHEDFQRLGFLDYLDGSHVCLIEWPCKIASLLPKEALSIHLSHITNTKRTITLSPWKRDLCQ